MSTVLWLVVGVGALITITGLVLFVAVWWQVNVRRLARPQAEPQGAGVWDVLVKMLDLIAKFTPRPYRPPVALMMVGAVIMGIGLGVGLGG